jgi:hypothetical protein
VLSAVLLEGVAAVTMPGTPWAWPVDAYAAVLLIAVVAAAVAALPTQAAGRVTLGDVLRIE